jgi:hypothetical protein
MSVTQERNGPAVRLDRGRVQLATPDAFHDLVGGAIPPGLPFIGAYGLAVASLDALKAQLAGAGLAFTARNGAVVAPFPEGLGQGVWVFVEDASRLPWRR